jgi:chemotaxis protein MotA
MDRAVVDAAPSLALKLRPGAPLLAGPPCFPELPLVYLIIGAIVVVASVLGGFMMVGGKVLALWHVNEIIVICGCALGAYVIGTPPKVMKSAMQGMVALLKGPKYRRADYVDLLKLIYEVLLKMRRDGTMSIEDHIENPKDSAIFQKYPKIAADHHVLEFITDCLRLMVGGNMNPHELESLLEYELETHHQEALEPSHSVQKVADALPGFGIVAAVLGIILTMSIVGSAPPAEIGEKVASALVGTFLGIFIAYGFVGPIASAMENRAHEEGKAFEVVKMALVASLRGYAPSVAIEFARKLLFSDVRPSFQDLEADLRAAKG